MQFDLTFILILIYFSTAFGAPSNTTTTFGQPAHQQSLFGGTTSGFGTPSTSTGIFGPQHQASFFSGTTSTPQSTFGSSTTGKLIF